jgi:uncharacterized protein (DUF2062 family)
MGMDTGSLKVLIAIPVYNHGRTLREVVVRALRVHSEVLVVDDGSTDGGSERLAGLPVRVLRHSTNLGKGAAILTAARAAQALGMSHIITLDADGQHDPADIPRFVSVLRDGPAAIVVGKRDFESVPVPGASRFGRAFSNFWLRVQTGLLLGDTQSGFRAYPVAVLGGLKLRERRFAFEIEVLVRAAWAGVELRETDVSVRYQPKGERVSHFHLIQDNLRLSLLNTRLTVRSMFPITRRRIVPDGQGGMRVTVLHPIQSVRALVAENNSPGRLAAAGALGVFLGALPLVAFHTVAILFAAGFFRLNRVVAVAASQLAMPPLVPALAIETGYFIRRGEFLVEISLRTLGYEGLDRLAEWLIGSLVVGPVLALLVGGVIYILGVVVRRENGAAA